ncbi:hypothetical protein [Gordonia iterans]
MDSKFGNDFRGGVMVRIEGLRPRAPRTQALRMLRPHLVPIAAIALAADEACTQLCEALYLDPASRRRYDSKSRGLLTAMVWSEGLREWTNEVNPPHVRLHEPHNWTELIVHGNLHVKVERDTPWRQVSQSERQRLRKQQCQDYTLPFDVVSTAEFAVTNVDLSGTLNGANRIVGVQARTRLGERYLWAPHEVDMDAARRMLVSWRRRRVPWLMTSDRALVLAATDATREEAARLRAENEDLRDRLFRAEADIAVLTRRAGLAADRSRFEIPTNPNAAEDTAADD